MFTCLPRMQPEMPRPKRRKLAVEPPTDPTEYIAQYCQRRRLPNQIGTSPLERECQRLAQEAREDFKQRRDASTTDSLDRKGLSPAEKYTIRLHNNRKSAEASKVYNEILKIEHAYRLATLSDQGVTSKLYQQRMLQDLKRQVEDLKSDKNRLNGALTYERDRAEKYKKQVQALQQAQFNLRAQPLQPPVNQSSQSQQHDNDAAPEPQSLHDRLVHSRGIMSSWTFSPPAESDVHPPKIHTGLTCTQSQPEESDDKPLVRALPQASMPLNLLGSQPSQENPYKTTLGSEDLPLPPGSDFFVGSQGTSKGRPS